LISPLSIKATDARACEKPFRWGATPLFALNKKSIYPWIRIKLVGSVSKLNLHLAGFENNSIRKGGNLTRVRMPDKHGNLIDNGLIIFYTDLITGNFMRGQLLTPSNLGKIALIELRMNGIR
jgi:hypothetical protein